VFVQLVNHKKKYPMHTLLNVTNGLWGVRLGGPGRLVRRNFGG
jgi:hypothetical protein